MKSEDKRVRSAERSLVVARPIGSHERVVDSPKEPRYAKGRRVNLRWDVALDNLPLLLEGLRLTIGLASLAMVFGVSLGWVLGLLRVTRIWVFSLFVWIWVTYARGTPILVQILLVYFGFSAFGIDWTPFQAGLFTFTVNTAGYSSEIVRGAIESVAKGQSDAAQSIGLSRFNTIVRILIPQAIRVSIPGLTNEMILLTKATSLLAVIGMAELTQRAQSVIARTFAPFEIYITIAIIYLILTTLLSYGARSIERRMMVNT